jgi:uncharacterized membrane protein YidH (DUF202 family)
VVQPDSSGRLPPTMTIVLPRTPWDKRAPWNGARAANRPSSLRLVERERFEDVVDATRRTRLASERTYLAWWRSALAAWAVSLGVGKVVPELTSGRSLGYEIVGVGYALLGVAFVGYGFWRQHLMEKALLEGRFIPFSHRAVLAFTAAGLALGLATMLVIVL